MSNNVFGRIKYRGFRRTTKSTEKTTSTAKKPFKNLVTKLKSKVANWNFRKLTKYFVVLAVLIGLVTSWVWYQSIYMTPERRFYAAIENGMAVPSVVRTLTQGGSGNQVVQSYRFHFAPQRLIENEVSYINRTATTDTAVTTEGVVYPDEQFLRYTDFYSQSQGEEEVDIDELLGEWAVEASDDDGQSELNYLSEQVTLAVFGNFNADFRKDLLQGLKDEGVYGQNLNEAREAEVNGEDVLQYSVGVRLKAYAQILNESFERAGYGGFPPLSPDNYREDARVNAVFQVRKRDNAIVGISFGGREEIYSDYGVVKNIERPEASLSIEELQQRVQTIFEQ